MGAMSGMSSQNATTPQETILSLLHNFTAQDVLRNPRTTDAHTFHPFTADASDAPLALLRELHSSCSTLIDSLQEYASMPVSDPKLVSILRQHGTIAQSLHVSSRETAHRAQTFRQRVSRGAAYGEPTPLDRSAVAGWAVARLLGWARDAGMETFQDEEKDGRIALVLGGRMLVVDIELSMTGSATAASTPSSVTADTHTAVAIARVKTSHALPNATAQANTHANGAQALDELLAATWNAYLVEVQRGELESTVRAAALGRHVRAQLAYLMKLDGLAAQEGDGGIRWFNDVGIMAGTAGEIAREEAEIVSGSLNAPAAPLDIFLSRAHALAMPYLTAPAMSFLVYLSPLVYHTLIRIPSDASSTGSSSSLTPKLDIPLPVLRKRLLSHAGSLPGAVIATLSLKDTVVRYEPHESPLPPLHRPQLLLPHGSSLAEPTALGHSFPTTIDPVSGLVNQGDAWVLDFTDGGRTEGIVVSQGRMRDVQLVVDPDGAMVDFGLPPPATHRSWVNLLLNAGKETAERFAAIHHSPSNAHPPLRLRLTPPEEAGFLLGKVPVRTLREVWGVLEVVRDQCWLNENLKLCEWSPEGPEDVFGDGDGEEATEADLDALLNGTFATQRIPVNVFLLDQPGPYLAALASSDPSAVDASQYALVRAGAPRLVMTVQTRERSPSLLQISVSHDRTRPRGVRVEVGGSLPLTTQQVDALEESARRGNVMGVAGKVWNWNLS